LRRSPAIRTHKAAAAQQYAAEPAGDDDGPLVEVLPVDGLQDRLARRTGRLAVIVEPVGLADASCRAIVRCRHIRMGGDEGFCLTFVPYGPGNRQEAALADLRPDHGDGGKGETV